MRSMGAWTAMRLSSLPVIMMGGEVRGKNKKMHRRLDLDVRETVSGGRPVEAQACGRQVIGRLLWLSRRRRGGTR
jgi:hypothetical protein